MRMRKRQFRIGELAERLKIERFIIRFWEKEFGIKTSRSQGRQRYYDELDLEKFILIKELLYERGFTIAGAKKELERLNCHPGRKLPAVARPGQSVDAAAKKRVDKLKKQLKEQREQFETQIVTLKAQLSKLRELL